ncbi:hypothetical protein [Marivita sp. XM-24bin2]|uniref:hypothetical protein n=1 Tax=Marivita sp. XM-24bin2 TaxID=2133951 RepID=UPI000D79CE03|nr:hypothetical protein [Marivita sp. XM-24bin2]PWL33546.1 MAG: hypothetical protein DCO97_19075 [Marivita sp. XM-24bin2]
MQSENPYLSIGYSETVAGKERHFNAIQTVFGDYVEVIAQSSSTPSVSIFSNGLVVVSVDENGTQYAGAKFLT